MTSKLNDLLNSRDETAKPLADPRTPDGSPSTAADVEAVPSHGAFSARSSYQQVDWDVAIPLAAMTPTSTKEAQARSPAGYMEIVSIVQIRGNPSNGIKAPDATGTLQFIAPRTFVL